MTVRGTLGSQTLGFGLLGEEEMAEVVRTPQAPDSKGEAPTIISGMNSADVQIISNKNGDVFLRVVNGSATEATEVTIITPNEEDGNPVADRVVTVPKETTRLIGPFDPDTYNNKKGQLEVKLSKVASVTMEVTRVAKLA